MPSAHYVRSASPTAPWRSLRSHSGRLRSLRVATAPWHGLSAKSVGANAPTPRHRCCQPTTPASLRSPADCLHVAVTLQFGNDRRIRFPVDLDTDIWSTLHRIPLEDHRIEYKTSYWWGSTGSHCYIKHGLKSALSGLKRGRGTFRYPCPDPLGFSFCHNESN